MSGWKSFSNTLREKANNSKSNTDVGVNKLIPDKILSNKNSLTPYEFHVKSKDIEKNNKLTIDSNLAIQLKIHCIPTTMQRLFYGTNDDKA